MNRKYGIWLDEQDARDAREAAELAEERADERREQERRDEIIACGIADAEEAAGLVEYVETKDPVWVALYTWKAAVTTPRYAEIGNGLFVRVGNGRRRNRRAA